MSCDRVSDCNGCTCHVSPPCNHCTEDHDNADNQISCKDCDSIINYVVPIASYDAAVGTLQMISKITIDAADKIMLIRDLESAKKWARGTLDDLGEP